MLGGVGHPQRHRPADAPVAEDDDCAGRVPCPIVDGGDGILDRNFMSVTPDQNAVRRQVHGSAMRNGHGHRIGDGLASRGVPDLQDFGHRSACRLLPRPACHCFRNDIEEGDVSLDVSANDGIANGVERDLGAFLLLEQRFFHELAVDGMPQRSQQSGGVDLAFDETALRAFLQRLFGHGLVFQAREHHQRDAGRGCVDPAHRFKSLRIGQPQIEQNDLDRMLRQVASRPRSRTSRASIRFRANPLVEHLAERTGVCGVVFDQQNRSDRFPGHPLRA